MPATRTISLTVAKADVGGWAGDATTHPDLLEAVVPPLDARAEPGGLLLDFIVTHAGDDIAIVFAHTRGNGAREIREAAREAFASGARRARELKLHGVASEPAIDYADLTFEERESEQFVLFLTDHAGPGSFNLPLYRAFADPVATWSLVADPQVSPGFRFRVRDLAGSKVGEFACPEECHALLGAVGRADRFAIASVASRGGVPAAAVSVEATHPDPVAIVRSGTGFPTLGEILEPWARPLLLPGPTPQHGPGPAVPVALDASLATRADGPPRAVALGFTLAKGELVGPLDLFADAAFDPARRDALRVADFLRRQGPLSLRGAEGPIPDPARWR